MNDFSTTQTQHVSNSLFFSHDFNTRNRQKIVRLRMKHGAEGYGIYIMLKEMLGESDNYQLEADFPMLAYCLQVKEDLLRSVIKDFSLFEFTENKESFYSQDLIARMNPLERKRQQRREAGIRSGKVRREKASADTEGANIEQNRTNIERNPNEIERTLNESAERTNIERIESKEQKESKESKETQETKTRCAIVTKKPIFIPPTITQVEHYCRQQNCTIDAQRFVNYYRSKDWKVGSSPMSDWQAAVCLWQRHDTTTRQKRSPNIAQSIRTIRYEKF